MRRLAAAVGLAVALVLLVGPAALADSTPVWDVDIEVRPDGTFRVTERITQTYDIRRRGIFRYIPVTERIAQDGLVTVPDGEPADWFQRIRIEDIRVLSPTAPDAVSVEKPSRHEPNGQVSIRIGEEDTFITGTHDYTVQYTVVGAMLPLDADTSVLRWDVVGDGWQQPIDQARVTVRGPGLQTEGVDCAIGSGSVGTECRIIEATTSQFRAESTGQLFFTPMSVNVPFDAAAVAPSDPILQRRFTVTGALYGDGRAIPLTLVLGLVAAAFTGQLLYREGRDREARGDVTVDGRIDTTHSHVGGERIRSLFGARTIPVEFTPPDGLRPAQLGLIIDERVDPVDVSATIVDLAVRGHLTIIENTSKVLWRTRTDWTLRSTMKDRVDLQRWEGYLLDGLFDGRTEVDVSDLKGSFASDYGKVERGLYEDGRLRKWFADRPDKVRSKWLGIGVVTMVLGIGLLALAAYFSRMALVAVPVILTGLVLAMANGRMPRRTPRGSALLTKTLGFRHFIETAEQDRARFAEQEHLFIEYLPYAVVFGATDKWAKAFEGLQVLTAAGIGYWYVGSGHFDAPSFSSGLSDFSSVVGSAAAAPTPSSSGGSGGGGFSGGGGGFGGGGGGSW